MKEIPLTRGMVAIVDDDLYDHLMQWRWFAVDGSGSHSKRGSKLYAARNIPHPTRAGSTTLLLMHRYIMQPPPGMVTDHIDGCTLRNTRDNLRVCTQAENSCNQIPRSGASVYKGVSRDHRTGRRPWRATIRKDGVVYYLGSFPTEEEAGRAYNEAAIRLHGEFAHLNPIPGERP